MITHKKYNQLAGWLMYPYFYIGRDVWSNINEQGLPNLITRALALLNKDVILT